MKKFGVVLCSALVGAAVVGGSVMAFSASADENNEVAFESLYPDYENKLEMEVADMADMVPVFAAIGARMDCKNDEYASSDEFVADTMGYLAYYAKDSLEGKCVEDKDNIYVDIDTFEQMAKTAFYNYDITENELLQHNVNTESYTIKKDDVCKKYTAEVESVVNIDGCENEEFYNKYEVVVKIKKGLFTNVKMKFTLEDNEYMGEIDNSMFKYAVTDVEVCK